MIKPLKNIDRLSYRNLWYGIGADTRTQTNSNFEAGVSELEAPETKHTVYKIESDCCQLKYVEVMAECGLKFSSRHSHRLSPDQRVLHDLELFAAKLSSCSVTVKLDSLPEAVNQLLVCQTFPAATARILM